MKRRGVVIPTALFVVMVVMFLATAMVLEVRQSFLLTRHSAEKARARLLAQAGAEEAYSELARTVADKSFQEQYLEDGDPSTTDPVYAKQFSDGSFEVTLRWLQPGATLLVESRGRSGGVSQTAYLTLATGAEPVVSGTLRPRGGGAGKPASSIFTYEPSSRTWQQLGPLPRLKMTEAIADPNGPHLRSGKFHKRIVGALTAPDGTVYAFAVDRGKLIEYRREMDGNWTTRLLEAPAGLDLKKLKKKNVTTDGKFLYAVQGGAMARYQPGGGWVKEWPATTAQTARGPDDFRPLSPQTDPDDEDQVYALDSKSSRVPHQLVKSGQGYVWKSLSTQITSLADAMQFAGEPQRPKHLSVGEDGQLISTDGKGAVWRWEDSRWERVPAPFGESGEGVSTFEEALDDEDEPIDSDELDSEDLAAGPEARSQTTDIDYTNIQQPSSVEWSPAEKPAYRSPGPTAAVLMPDGSMFVGYRGFDDEDNAPESLVQRPGGTDHWVLAPKMHLDGLYTVGSGWQPGNAKSAYRVLVPQNLVMTRSGPDGYQRRSFGYGDGP